MVPFSFLTQEMVLTADRALYWPRERALLVADLHLEKASYFAQFGQMLPPYDSRETLERLALAIRETGARKVIALGDNFHDDNGTQRLDTHTTGMLSALTRATEWIWITGNHDPGLNSQANRDIGGDAMDELSIDSIVLRHKASPEECAAEISGHYHPGLKVRAKGRSIARPCTVLGTHHSGQQRLILPAFGALTGSMNASDPAIISAMQPADTIDALVPASGRLVQYPLWRTAV